MFLFVAVTGAFAPTLIMITAPDPTQSVWRPGAILLGRVIPVPSITMSMAVVTTVLVIRFLTAPVLKPALLASAEGDTPWLTIIHPSLRFLSFIPLGCCK